MSVPDIRKLARQRSVSLYEDQEKQLAEYKDTRDLSQVIRVAVDRYLEQRKSEGA